MNIAVVGYLGFGNFGDELFLKTFRQLFPNDEVQPWTPEMDRSWIDRVIIGGGDLIRPDAFWEPYFPVALAGLPTVVYGVGVVQGCDAEPAQVDLYRQALRDARAVVTRDPDSARLMRDYGMYPAPETAPDIVFAYHEPTLRLERLSPAPTVGVVIANYPSAPLGLIKRLVAELLPAWQAVLIPVVEHPTNSYADRVACDRLWAEIVRETGHTQATITPETFNPEHTYRRLQSLDLVISCKLHPALVALRVGVPVLCLGSGHKVKHLMDEFALGWACLPFDAEPAKALSTLLTLAAYRHDLRVPLCTRAKALEAEAGKAAARLVSIVHA